MHRHELTIPEIKDYEVIPKGDMPGDKIQIDEDKAYKAKHIFPRLVELLDPFLKKGKAVISVHGGSGVGKSEIGSLLAFYLNYNEISTYILSGDNYPHRIPRDNDTERLRVFREYGMKGLVRSGRYHLGLNEDILNLQRLGQDYSYELCHQYPGLDTYQESGRAALVEYLGTPKEIDYDEINQIIYQFKNEVQELNLKRMGREADELWYEKVDVGQVEVLLIEWTHGNNPNLKGIDIPILLNSTPEETKKHRQSRNRDKGIDSPFTTMVLEIEQAKLDEQANSAKIIVLKNGKMISYDEYRSEAYEKNK